MIVGARVSRTFPIAQSLSDMQAFRAMIEAEIAFQLFLGMEDSLWAGDYAIGVDTRVHSASFRL